MMRSLPSNASEDISKNTMQDASVEPENNVFPDEIDQFLQNEFLPQDMETSFSSEQMREFQTICENTSGRAENTLCIFSPNTQCTLSEILELDGDDCLHIP